VATASPVVPRFDVSGPRRISTKLSSGPSRHLAIHLQSRAPRFNHGQGHEEHQGRTHRQDSDQRLRARLDEGSGDSVADTQLLDLVDFWTQIRSIIAVNDASVGLDALDEVAATVLLQDDATPAVLTKTVLLLVSPESMQGGQATEHEVFAPPAAPTVPTQTKRASRRSPLTSAKPPPAKKQKRAEPLP